jgi:surfeit locus 1 family protein
MLKLTQKINPIASVLTGIFVLITASLGIWQLDRLAQKQKMLANLKSPEYLDVSSGPITEESSYLKVRIKGQFLANHTYLYRKNASIPGIEGYYVLSPFRSQYGQMMLVVRGWVRRSDKHLADQSILSAESEILGLVLPEESSGFLVSSGDSKRNIWFRLDIEEIARGLKTQLSENFYLIQNSPSDLPNFIVPVSLKKDLNIRNDHLEYAITWFCLCISAMIVFIIYHRQPSKNQ